MYARLPGSWSLAFRAPAVLGSIAPFLQNP
jgi:hypothetical protein